GKPDDAVGRIDRRRLAGQIARGWCRPIGLCPAGCALLILGLLRQVGIVDVLAILRRLSVRRRDGGRRGLPTGARNLLVVLLLELTFENANALLHLLEPPQQCHVRRRSSIGLTARDTDFLSVHQAGAERRCGHQYRKAPPRRGKLRRSPRPGGHSEVAGKWSR